MEGQANDWNRRDIASPPHSTLAYSMKEDEKIIRLCLPILRDSFSYLYEYFNKKEHVSLTNEFAILNAMISCQKKLSKEKFYKLLLKIRKCNQRLVGMQIEHLVSKLLEMVPDIAKYKTIRLPTRQLFEFLLLRIFGAFQLLLTIETLCIEVGKFLILKLQTGLDFWIATMFLPALARIRVLTINYAQQLAYFYDKVIPLLQYMKGSPRFNLSQSSSLEEELSNHCRYKKDDEANRDGTPGKNEPRILDIFEEAKEMDLDAGVSRKLSTCKEDIASELENSFINESLSAKDAKSDKAKSLCAHKRISKNITGNSERGTKKKLKSVKEDLLSLLDLLGDNNVAETEFSSESGHNPSSINMHTASNIDNSTMKTGDLGEVVNVRTARSEVKSLKRTKNHTDNLSVKKKKLKNKIKKGSICNVASKNLIGRKERSLKKKKKVKKAELSSFLDNISDNDVATPEICCETVQKQNSIGLYLLSFDTVNSSIPLNDLGKSVERRTTGSDFKSLKRREDKSDNPNPSNKRKKSMLRSKAGSVSKISGKNVVERKEKIMKKKKNMEKEELVSLLNNVCGNDNAALELCSESGQKLDSVKGCSSFDAANPAMALNDLGKSDDGKTNISRIKSMKKIKNQNCNFAAKKKKVKKEIKMGNVSKIFDKNVDKGKRENMKKKKKKPIN